MWRDSAEERRHAVMRTRRRQEGVFASYVRSGLLEQ